MLKMPLWQYQMKALLLNVMFLFLLCVCHTILRGCWFESLDQHHCGPLGKALTWWFGDIYFGTLWALNTNY